MSRLALPNGLAEQQQHKALIFNLRCQIAMEVYSQLVPISYQSALAKAAHDADPFDTQPEDGEPQRIQFQLDLGCPARAAVAAADVLMMALRIVPPPQARRSGGGRRADLKEGTDGPATKHSTVRRRWPWSAPEPQW
jgi:hypothetical protein